MTALPQAAEPAADDPDLVPRYTRRTDTPDDYTCDHVWIDRLTGQEVLRYDAADPANTSPAYGARPDPEVLAQKGHSVDEEIPLSLCATPVSAGEAAAWRRTKAARVERELEEAAARDLLDFLGDDATGFDFGRWSDGEAEILRPALERRGFTAVSFYMGEQDSFGPLSRGCVARDPTNKRVRFYYG